MTKEQGELALLPAVQQREYQQLLASQYEALPDYLTEENLWVPYVHEAAHYDRLIEVQKALQVGALAILDAAQTDKRLHALLSIREADREELNRLKDIPLSPQLVRPDYIYDHGGRPRVCEINTRFIFNGNIASTHMAAYLSRRYDIDTEPYQRLNDWLVKTYGGSDAEEGPVVFAQDSEPEHDITLQKQRSEAVCSVSSEALRLLDPGKIGRLVLELHQHELAGALEDVISLKLAGVPVHNDPRVIMLLHDKRLLVPLSDKEYMADLVGETNAQILADGIVPSYHPGWEGREPERIAAKSALAKGAISGKGDSLQVVRLADYAERLDDPAAYVYQPRISQPKLISPKGEELEIAGTLPMTLNDEVFGPGIVRVYPRRRLKGFKGLTIAVKGSES